MQNGNSNGLFFNRLVAVIVFEAFVSFELFYAVWVNVKFWILGTLSGSTTPRNHLPCRVFPYNLLFFMLMLYLSFCIRFLLMFINISLIFTESSITVAVVCSCLCVQYLTNSLVR